MTTCESHWGISGPCKIVYDRWDINMQKSVSFSGRNSDRLSVVLVKSFKTQLSLQLKTCTTYYDPYMYASR